ncbi:MAG: hypothetical protein CL928_19125 [Deltaproteobacteria bacterium]|nr:hypothetical protein [Deltaproteobacteria bacterium]
MATLRNSLLALVATLAFFGAILALVTSAQAAPRGAGVGLELTSVLVRGDTVRVEYSSKVRGCGLLTNRDGRELHSDTGLFCRKGVDVVAEYDITEFRALPGQSVRLCTEQLQPRCDAPVEVREAGDLNGDQEINVIDLMLLYWEIMDTSPASWPNSYDDVLAADLNGDDAINVIDILLLLDVINGSAE